MAEDPLTQTLILIQKVWALLLIALYFSGFMAEYHFPGVSETVSASEGILRDVEKVLFFGLMAAGLLVDVVRMREDRDKAFIFLFLSLLLGTFSGIVGSLQYQAISLLLG